jgi:hypothetical protein
MKKLATLLLCLTALNLNAEFTPLQKEVLKEIEKTKSFESQEYKTYMSSFIPSLSSNMLYMFYDLNKNGIIDMGAVFKIAGTYMDKSGKLQFVPEKKANVWLLIDEKTKEQICYGDIDGDGIFDTNLSIPGKNKSSFENI